MLAAALIVFREVFEAGLILGIVLSATRTVPGRGRWIAGGVLAGLAGAVAVAVFAGVIADALSGVGAEVFNAAVLGIAAAMLGWHNIWMARHGREMTGNMRALGQAVATGGRTLAALAVVIAAAMLREGSELVLFLYGLMASGHDAAGLAVGALLGLGGGAATAGLLYMGLGSIPTKHLFSVTNTMLALLAAGMAAGAVGFLIDADLVPPLGRAIWDTSAVLDVKSIVGRALHTLVGYTDRPAGLQIMVYAAVLGVLLLSGRHVSRAAPPARARPA